MPGAPNGPSLRSLRRSTARSPYCSSVIPGSLICSFDRQPGCPGCPTAGSPPWRAEFTPSVDRCSVETCRHRPSAPAVGSASFHEPWHDEVSVTPGTSSRKAKVSRSRSTCPGGHARPRSQALDILGREMERGRSAEEEGSAQVYRVKWV